MESVGERIQRLRKKFKMTQADLANKLGLEQAAVSKYETNRVPLTQESLLKLAQIFSVSTDYILGNNDKNTKKEEKHQIAFFNGIESLSEKDKELVQNLIDSLKNKNK